MPDHVATCWRALACAILVRAWRDARSTNGAKAAKEAGLPAGMTLADDARQFLAGDGAIWLVGLLDLDGQIIDAMRAELPPVLWEQLALNLEVL